MATVECVFCVVRDFRGRDVIRVFLASKYWCHVWHALPKKLKWMYHLFFLGPRPPTTSSSQMDYQTFGFRRTHNSISLLLGLLFAHHPLHHPQWIWKVQCSKLHFPRYYLSLCLDDVDCLLITQSGSGWVAKNFPISFQRPGFRGCQGSPADVFETKAKGHG